MKKSFVIFMILCGSVFANSAVELSDGTFLKSSDYIPYPGQNRSSNNLHLMRLGGKLNDARNKLRRKCEDRTFTSSNLNELINLNNDLLKVASLRLSSDGKPVIGSINHRLILRRIKDPFDIDVWRNCGVDIKSAYQR